MSNPSDSHADTSVTAADPDAPETEPATQAEAAARIEGDIVHRVVLEAARPMIQAQVQRLMGMAKAAGQRLGPLSAFVTDDEAVLEALKIAPQKPVTAFVIPTREMRGIVDEMFPGQFPTQFNPSNGAVMDILIYTAGRAYAARVPSRSA